QMSGHTPTRRAPLLTIYSVLVFIFIYLPVAVLMLYSFNRDGVGGFPPRHLTLEWYRLLFADAPIWDAVGNSLIVAAGSVALSLIAACILIYTLSMDEIAVSFFLIGRDNTLPLEIWGRLRRGITPEINAVSTLIFAVSVALIVIWYRVRTRGLGSDAQELLERL